MMLMCLKWCGSDWWGKGSVKLSMIIILISGIDLWWNIAFMLDGKNNNILDTTV